MVLKATEPPRWMKRNRCFIQRSLPISLFFNDYFLLSENYDQQKGNMFALFMIFLLYIFIQ